MKTLKEQLNESLNEKTLDLEGYDTLKKPFKVIIKVGGNKGESGTAIGVADSDPEINDPGEGSKQFAIQLKDGSTTYLGSNEVAYNVLKIE